MPSQDTFTITAAPGTDIWRKPPTTDVFNAPTAIPPANSPNRQRTSGPLTSFRSARLSLNFTPQAQYDQGGLLLSFRPRGDSAGNNSASASSASSASTPPPPKWIKTGIEFFDGRPRLSTVACDSWADWSIADLAVPSQSTDGRGNETGWTTLLVEKDKDGNGTGLWVYRVAEDGTGAREPLREICWVFGLGQQGGGEGWEVEVSGMAARPAKEAAAGGLEVEFRGFEVQWAD